MGEGKPTDTLTEAHRFGTRCPRGDHERTCDWPDCQWHGHKRWDRAVCGAENAALERAEEVAFQMMMKIHAKDGISCGTVAQIDVRDAIRALKKEMDDAAD